MKHTLFWNCRGARKKRTSHVIQGILGSHDVGLIGLFETQVELLSRIEIDKLFGRSWDFFHFPSSGRSGGILLAWIPSFFEVHILASSAQCVLTSIFAKNSPIFQVGFVYGNKNEYVRRDLWSEISASFDSSIPTIIGGDFNCITSHLDKKGGKEFTSSTGSREMLEFLSSFDLHDGGFVGPRFTWTNNKTGCSKIWVRHDRVYLNSKVLLSFPFARVLHLPRIASDHCPVLLQLSPPGKRKQAIWLRFEDAWLSSPEVFRVVQSAWRSSKSEPPDAKLHFLCKKTLRALHFWSKNTLKSLIKCKDQLEGEILELQSLEVSTNGITYEQQEELRSKVLNLNSCLGRLSTWWRQRAKVRWIKDGDQNTTFFHTVASSRRRSNHVNSMKDGELTTSVPKRINDIIFEFFSNKWQGSSISLDDWPAFDHLPNIGELFGESLMAEVTNEEIFKTLCSMNLNRAPGLDGITTSFFKAFWPIVGLHVCNAIKFFFANGSMFPEWKKTAVILIPKSDNPDCPEKLRPISLCQSTYKIIAKIIVMRLKVFLPQLISKEQAAFVPTRSISHHVLLAQEVCNKFKNSTTSKGLFMAKIDMAQAYDKMSWETLKCVLTKFRFPNGFIDLILACVTSPQFSVVINGKRSKLIQASCGFRQGCPLSPYLFILCSELLSLAIHQRGSELGFPIAPSGPILSHLLYADDVLIFGSVSSHNFAIMRKILNSYCGWTGQDINKQKSSIMFNKNMRRPYKYKFARIAGFTRVDSLEYLGVPLAMRKLTKNDFVEIISKAHSKVSNWGVRFLSMAGRSTLIGSSLLPMCTYLLTHCEVPQSVLLLIERIAKKFLWQTSHSSRGIHYVPWDLVCQPFDVGGLGLHLSARWHGPLRSRLTLNLLQDRDSLLSQSIKSKYGDDVWNPRFKRGDSSTWHLLCDGAASLRLITRWVVGDGASIDVLKHAWIRDMPLDRWPTIINTNVCSSCRLKDFIIDGEWNLEKLITTFELDLATTIMDIPINNSQTDVIELNKKLSGRSTAALAYDGLFPSASARFAWLKRLKLQPRVRLFWWRLLWNAIPSRCWLTFHRLANDDQCPWNCGTIEDISHVAFGCQQVLLMLQIFSSWGFSMPTFSSLDDFIIACSPSSPYNLKVLQLYCFIIYYSWRNRNDKIHGQPVASPTSLAAQIFAGFSYAYPTLMLEQWDTIQPSRLVTNQTWCPPPPGWLKVNIDGALQHNYRGGAGFVFRDSLGQILSCGGSAVQHWDASQVELFAISILHLGIRSEFLDFDGIIVEGDSRNVISCIRDKFKCNLTADFNCLEKTLSSLAGFKNVVFNFVPRICNKLAHSCAHLSLSLFASFLWDHIPLDFAPLSHVVLEDLG